MKGEYATHVCYTCVWGLGPAPAYSWLEAQALLAPVGLGDLALKIFIWYLQHQQLA